jgi:hypothetical protein
MNNEIFHIAKEEKNNVKNLKNRRHSWRGKIFTQNEFVVNLLERTISEKKGPLEDLDYST